MKRRILVDLDGIVADLMPAWLGAYGRATGQWIDPNDVADWGVQQATDQGILTEVLRAPGFFLGIQPVHGAIESVRALCERHEVFIVSAASHAENLTDKGLWVREHLPFIKKRRFVLMHEKHLIEADAIIDDKPDTAINFRRAQPDAVIASIKYPYNQGCQAYSLLADDHRSPKVAWRTIVQHFDRTWS